MEFSTEGKKKRCNLTLLVVFTITEKIESEQMRKMHVSEWNAKDEHKHFRSHHVHSKYLHKTTSHIFFLHK